MGTMDMHMGMSSLCSLWLQVPPAPEPPEPSASLGLGSFGQHSLALNLPGLNPFYLDGKGWPSFLPLRMAAFPGMSLWRLEVAFPSLKHEEQKNSGPAGQEPTPPCLPGLPSLLRAHPLKVTPEMLQWEWGRKWKPWLPHHDNGVQRKPPFDFVNQRRPFVLLPFLPKCCRGDQSDVQCGLVVKSMDSGTRRWWVPVLTMPLTSCVILLGKLPNLSVPQFPQV